MPPRGVTCCRFGLTTGARIETQTVWRMVKMLRQDRDGAAHQSPQLRSQHEDRINKIYRINR